MWTALVTKTKREIVLKAVTAKVNGFTDIELDKAYVSVINQGRSLTP
jgi:hypothetical protein